MSLYDRLTELKSSLSALNDAISANLGALIDPSLSLIFANVQSALYSATSAISEYEIQHGIRDANVDGEIASLGARLDGLDERMGMVFEALGDVSGMLEARLDDGSLEAIRAARSVPTPEPTPEPTLEQDESAAGLDEVVSPLEGERDQYVYIRYNAILRQSPKAILLRTATGELTFDKGIWLAKSQIVFDPASPKSVPGRLPISRWLADKVGLKAFCEESSMSRLNHEWGADFAV